MNPRIYVINVCPHLAILAAFTLVSRPEDLGPVFRKPRKLFGPSKLFLVSLYLKTEK